MGQLSSGLMVANFGIGMANIIDKMGQLVNMLAVPKFGTGTDNAIDKMGQLSNVLVVTNFGITTVKESTVNPTKSFYGWSN